MKILVTGAGGFIGRSLVQYLAEKKHEVIALDNNLRGSLPTLPSHKNIIPIEGDVLDATQMNKLCQDIDAVYHLAYINGTKYFYSIPDKILEIGIIGTHNILKACLKNKTPRFYLASSSETYQTASVIPTPESAELKVPDVLNPRYSYGGGKIACELLTVNYLRNSPIQYAIFRPHNIYGPQMGFEHVIPELIRKIYTATQITPVGEPIKINIMGSGDETRAFMYISDAIEAIYLCSLANEDNGIYHVGNNEELKIIEVINTIAQIKKIKIQIIPSEGASGSTLRRCPDNTKIIQLGYTQNISLREGLEKTIDWYWKHYSKLTEKPM